jgi:Zn finger protein HypA/HybF involved in hydrogenase expression
MAKKSLNQNVLKIFALCGLTAEPVELREWACDECHSVFYTYDLDCAHCPLCGSKARRCGKITFFDIKKKRTAK